MRLLADYHDFYDHAFDGSWTTSPVLDRRSVTNRHRRQDHDDLEAAGFRVPRRGRPADLLTNALAAVVYVDPTAHAGDGKILLDVHEAVRLHPDAYCSAFLGRGNRTSYRLLLIGELGFWLRYQSQSTNEDEWRSNVDPAITETDPPGVKEDVEALMRSALALRRPLVAVDFVEARELLFAVDMNTAPGLRGTPIEGKLRPDAIHAAIKARWEALA